MAAAAPHAAPAAGRRRLRQDRGGADGDGDRRRGRRAGRADGADRGAGAPARRDHRAARRCRRACASALLTGREKGRAARRAAGAPGGAARSTSSSARTRCSRPTSRSSDLAFAVIDEQHRFGVHQRLALQTKGGKRRRQRAGDDGDADPAHAADDALRRPRRVAPDREAGRPQADRHQAIPVESHRAADRAACARSSARARRSTGSAR